MVYHLISLCMGAVPRPAVRKARIAAEMRTAGKATAIAATDQSSCEQLVSTVIQLSLRGCCGWEFLFMQLPVRLRSRCEQLVNIVIQPSLRGCSGWELLFMQLSLCSISSCELLYLQLLLRFCSITELLQMQLSLIF